MSAARAEGGEGGAALARSPASLPGVGPARAAALARLGVTSLRALLHLVPHRLEESAGRTLAREAVAREGLEVALVGTLRGLRLFRAGRRRTVLSLDLVDASGLLRVLFFNQPWLFERLRALATAGTPVELVGRVGRTQQGPALLAPRLVVPPAPERAAGLVPVYPATAGLRPELLRRLIAGALEAHGAELGEPLPAPVLAALALVPLPEAVRNLHRPATRAAFREARRRLAFERLLALQARLAAAREAAATRRARAVVLAPEERAELCARVPFALTAGQERVLAEILADLARAQPMRRLLQGDVGAGKTIVALLACAAVARAGGQAALLAPTEVLAEQHHLGLAEACARLGLTSVLVTGTQRAAARRAALAALAEGRAPLAIGTHALLGEAVRFARLDLVVIDEQQRFGVAQKQALLEKGAETHALLLTATPIPRTLALCYYGDLETSRLAERPQGRGPLVTRVIGPAGRAEVEAFVLERARAGERVFWVCPRIVDEPLDEASDEPLDEAAARRAERAAAERVHAALAAGPLAGPGLGLLHGKLPPARRAAAIERFRRGADAILVATSMVEVGVDVPEASVMVIEGAPHFGLAQLHQLRGRVGRSHRPAWCFLLAERLPDARLELLADCNDGFVIAEEDLRRRGMGDLAGLRQAGENLEGLGDEELDLALVEAARALVRADADLRAHYLGLAEGAALV
ncbi:MAG TPA: DEAD/DEAH box helicase [Planctomycetota bacterium]